LQVAEVTEMFQGPKIPLRVSFSVGAFNIRSRFLNATIDVPQRMFIYFDEFRWRQS